MEQKWEGLECVDETVNAVVESQQRSETPQALSKLDSLVVRNIEENAELKYFQPFMQLASPRRIDGLRLDCQGNRKLSFSPGTSLVECLKLSQSAIPGNVFSILLGGFKALNVLQFSPFSSAEDDLRVMRNTFFYAFSLLRESSVPNLKTLYAHVAEWQDHFLPPEGHFNSSTRMPATSWTPSGGRSTGR